MTKQQKLEVIYEAMADKTFSEGCILIGQEIIEGNRNNLGKEYRTICHRVLGTYSLGTDFVSHRHIYRLNKIIGHPVRIGDVLKYIDTHHCLIDVEEGHSSRDMEALDSMLRAVFYSFVGKQDRPIDEQDESCIAFVYSLIQK